MDIRVRFAPSPTGYLHVGGARTALFNYLFARHNRGSFILRIEDTDRNRFKKGALEEIFDSLRWLGLDWDEGPEIEGEYGPYFQSHRSDLYKKHAGQLINSGHAYRCFCTIERLSRIREDQEKAKVAHVSGYDRHCRNLSSEDEYKFLDQGKPYVVRLKIPLDRRVSFLDMVRGEIDYNSNDLDDLVLLKSDGYPTYHLANVVDDHLMRISHVLRGDEWITSTPRHVIIYEAFGWELPKFAHLPVILASSGGKLSKRKGAASVMDYKNEGYLPGALVNFLALLGWAPGDDREEMSISELIELFSLEKVNPKSSVFDEKKLEWMNGLYMRKCDVESIAEDVLAKWKELKFISPEDCLDNPKLKQIISMMKERSKKLSDLVDNSVYFFRDPETYEEKAVRKRWKGNAVDIMRDLTDIMDKAENFTRNYLEDIFRSYAEKNTLSGGKLIHPVRLAVTGVSFGPGLFEILEILGKDTAIRRMKTAIQSIEITKNNL